MPPRATLLPVRTLPTLASADCLKDMTGEVYCGAGHCQTDFNGTVWCSQYYDGYAVRNSEGQVVCGKGQCVKQSDGQVLCSTEVGGTALIDSKGNARCYGQCEPGTADMCENTIAGS